MELLHHRVREELESLPEDTKERFRRIAELIQSYGLERSEWDLALERAKGVK